MGVLRPTVLLGFRLPNKILKMFSQNHLLLILAGMNFLFYVQASTIFNNTTDNTTIINCGETIGTCLGFYFDGIIVYLDSLGFLDASYGLAVLLFKTTLTLLSYPSVQFLCFWVFLCYILCFFFKPLLMTLWCLLWPMRKIAIVTRKAVRPCFGGLTPKEVRAYRTYLAQGDDGNLDDNLSPQTAQVGGEVEETDDITDSLSVPLDHSKYKTSEMIRAKCENDLIISNKKGECPIPNMATKDSTCGTVEYGTVQETSVPRVAFIDRTGPSSVEVEKCYSRMTRVNIANPIVWTSGATAGTVIWSANFRDLLNNNSLYKQLRARYTNIRFDLRFLIQVQHNTSALGSILAIHHNNNVTAAAPSGLAMLYNYGVFQHVWITASEDRTGVLEVKFPSPLQFRDTYNTSLTNDPFRGESGFLRLIVGHALSVPAGVPTSMFIEVHMQMVNIKATYSQAPRYTTQGLIDITTNNFDNIKDSTLNTTKGGDKFDTILGLDHPSDTRQPMSMIRRTFQKFFATRGPLDVQRLTYNQSDTTIRKVTGQDEMSVPYLMSCPNIYDTFTINSGIPKGDKIVNTPLHPYFAGTDVLHHPINSSSYGFIYDSVTLNFKIPKTIYQTGKLFVCLNQGLVDNFGNVQGVQPNLTTSYDLLSLPGMIIDLNSKEFEHNFTIPWHALVDMMPGCSTLGQPGFGSSYFTSNVTPTTNFQFSCPVVTVYCLIPPSTSANVANSINGIISVCWSGYRGLYGHNPAVITNLSQGANTTVEIARKPFVNKIDDFISLRQLWQQPHMHQSGVLKSTSSCYRYRMADLISSFELIKMYAYAQGSVRLLICFSSWACDYIVIEHTDPNVQRPTVTPTDAVMSSTTDLFLSDPQTLSGLSYIPFSSTNYNPNWKGNGTLNKPIFVDKNSPYVIMEIPIIRPWGSMSIRNDNMGGVINFSSAGETQEAFAHCEIFVMAGDDFRASHISAVPINTIADAVGGVALPPWDF